MRHFYLIFMVMLYTSSLLGETLGPFKITTIHEKYVYFTGNGAGKLRYNLKYKVLKLKNKSAPLTLFNLVPAGGCKLYAISTTGGILEYSRAVSGTLKANDLIVLLRGKFTLGTKKKIKTKPVENIGFLKTSYLFYTPHIYDFRFLAGYKALNLFAGMGFTLKTGVLTFSGIENDDEEGVSIEKVVNHTFGGVELLSGWSTQEGSFMFGIIGGISDDENAVGWGIDLRIGSLTSTFIYFDFLSILNLDLLELNINGRIQLRPKVGDGIAFYYRISSIPDLEHTNNVLMVGYGVAKKNFYLDVLFGGGLAGKYHRGTAMNIAGGILF